jgi:DNA polymerase III alpha subunit
MYIDKYGNSVYQDSDILELLYQKKYSLLDQIFVENSSDIEKFEEFANTRLKKITDLPNDLSVEDFDKISQEDWFIPDEYKNIDIESYLVHLCPEENYQRLIDELEEFRRRDMIVLLKTLKYLVDTFRKNNIVWGVGRGSSVASYTLYLLGVHKIDSVKYNLDWQEFLR